MNQPINGYRELSEAEIKMINAVKSMCAGISRTIGELHRGNFETGEKLYASLQGAGAKLASGMGAPTFIVPDEATDAQRAEIVALSNALALIDPSHNCLAQAAARLVEVEMWMVRAIAKPSRS